MKKFLLLIPLCFFSTACSLGSLAGQITTKPVPLITQSPAPVVCPTDTETCPDGSSVGRVGQDCVFEICPAITKPLTEADAIRIVTQLPEVKRWYTMFTGPGQTGPITGGKPKVVVDSMKDDEYVIHVYEQTPDHTATMNWYYVNIKTGAIKEEFPSPTQIYP